MKPCPEAIRPAGRTGAKGKEAVERKQFYQVEIARRFQAGGFFISAREAQDELAAPIEAKEPVVWLRRRPGSDEVRVVALKRGVERLPTPENFQMAFRLRRWMNSTRERPHNQIYNSGKAA
jgi:hypothetical protein